MKPLFLLFISILLILPTESVDLTCPKNVITSNTQTGSFPASAGALFPANYACSIQFNIPVGQVVKIGIQNNLLFDTNDTFTIQDSASTVYNFYITDKVFYAPSNNAKVQITTQSNKSSFYFTWQFMDVTTYSKITNPTGTIIQMNLTANNYYQFTSSKSQVAFHTGSISGNHDSATRYIYVYDGADLTANFMGNLEVFTYNISVSTGRTLTLVNFYGSPVESYGIANDYSAISAYDGYSFFVLRSDMDFFTHGTSATGKEYAMTLFSIDSPESYISYIKFLNLSLPGQEVRVKPMGPMDGYANLLNYPSRGFDLDSLPQQILTNTFTVSLYQCDVYFGVRSRASIDWKQANPGRTGFIISPSLWNPKALFTSPYSTNFTSSQKVKFVFDLQSVVIGKAGEKIKIEVGSPNSSPSIVEFDKTATNTGTKVAHGTYMATTFTGTSASSSFNMKFSIENDMETTTKSTGRIFISFTAILVLVFNYL